MCGVVVGTVRWGWWEPLSGKGCVWCGGGNCLTGRGGGKKGSWIPGSQLLPCLPECQNHRHAKYVLKKYKKKLGLKSKQSQHCNLKYFVAKCESRRNKTKVREKTDFFQVVLKTLHN